MANLLNNTRGLTFMKKIAMYATLILFVMCFFTGCSDAVPEPATMTFEGTHEFHGEGGGTATVQKRFTINELLEFNVTFLSLTGNYRETLDGLAGLGIVAGAAVAGEINTNNIWTDLVVEGTAVNMRSDQITILSGLGIAMAIRLEYTELDGAIAGVNIVFPGAGYPPQGLFDNIGDMLMGGFYTRTR